PKRGLYVGMMEGVSGAGDLALQALSGRGIDTRQVDDARHTWGAPVFQEQPQPLALAPWKRTEAHHPATEHVGHGSIM
ncbi:MAG: hypothetical protein NTY18_04715, partial [Deltaproteobacteria bacterium]|nr:hypothetical protein [Deltaproteobacteria bacterium]